LESVLPSYKPALNLLASLGRLSRRESVVLSAITLKPGKLEELEGKKNEVSTERVNKKLSKKTTDNLQDFSLDFTVEGNLNQVGAFITGLERVAPLMKIERFSLNLSSYERREDRVILGSVSAGLTVRVYHQMPPETIGEITSALPVLSNEQEEAMKKLTEFVVYEPVQPIAPIGKNNIFTPLPGL
jgi:hypothetical protein